MPPEIDDGGHADGEDPLLGDLPEDVGEVAEVEEDRAARRAPARRRSRAARRPRARGALVMRASRRRAGRRRRGGAAAGSPSGTSAGRARAPRPGRGGEDLLLGRVGAFEARPRSGPRGRPRPGGTASGPPTSRTSTARSPKPSRRELAQQRVDLGLGGEVDAARRLVEQQHLRRREEAAREQRLLLVAAARASPIGDAGDAARTPVSRMQRAAASRGSRRGRSSRARLTFVERAERDVRGRRARSGKIACALRSSGRSTRPASRAAAGLAGRTSVPVEHGCVPSTAPPSAPDEREQEIRAAGADEAREAHDLAARGPSARRRAAR